MVKGLARFRDHFREERGQYVLIGGVAAMHWLEQAALQARATKDLDIVLLVEGRESGFQHRFWEFVRAGGYENRQTSSGGRVYYRFSHPREQDYPFMLELFSRKPDGLDLAGAPRMTPIPGGEDISSLSAILMDDAYYGIVRENVQEEDGLPMLRPEGLILLKARAWVDLTERKAQGGAVDERDVRKHRTDVFQALPAADPGQPRFCAGKRPHGLASVSRPLFHGFPRVAGDPAGIGWRRRGPCALPRRHASCAGECVCCPMTQLPP